MKSSTVVITTIIVVIIVAIAGVYAYAWSGLYDIGADSHHTKPVEQLIGTLRRNSIARRTQDLTPPNLDDPALVQAGAGHYAGMCTGCHLAPGKSDNAMRKGLYPHPPTLTKFKPNPRDAFWAIKHGIKMSAMPHWGDTLDDGAIWSIVAFLQKMPDMTQVQYQNLVALAHGTGGMGGAQPAAAAAGPAGAATAGVPAKPTSTSPNAGQ
ncbi:MAG: cytochrome c [Rhodanobacter sp.]